VAEVQYIVRNDKPWRPLLPDRRGIHSKSLIFRCFTRLQLSGSQAGLPSAERSIGLQQLRCRETAVATRSRMSG
jgi:hypothetical protein